MFDSLFKTLITKISWSIFINRATGLENIPRNKGFIIAANHTSYMDIWILAVVFYLKEKNIVRFIAKKILTKDAHVKTLIRLFGPLTVPIYFDSNTSKEELFEEATKTLKKGQIIGIFPEGERNTAAEIRKGKTGMTRLAIISKSPIVPIGINGTYEIMPKKNTPKFKKIVTLNIGKPIYLNKYYNKKITKKLLRNINDEIMKEIAKLAGRRYSY